MSLDQNPSDIILKDPKKIDISKLDMFKVIGDGSTCIIKLAKNMEDNHFYAVK